MLLQTLLNRCQKLKSFVYRRVGWETIKGVEALVVEVVPRKNSHPRCSQCGCAAAIYDHQPQPRLFQFVPLWGISVYLRYLMRRVNCPQDGVRIEGS